jgi:HD superfamily phosphohydrolase YqeK
MAADPMLQRAAAGELPSWVQMSTKRRAHVQRVADLIGGWSTELAPRDETRWRAAAWLHDSLRDAEASALIEVVPAEFQDWHPSLLHGPAAAARLRHDGLKDESVLRAVTFHTVGHADLDQLGRCLYLADFLEPGRKFGADWRATLREEMPRAHERVLRDVAAARIGHLIEERSPLRPETLGFWNALVALAGETS